MIFAAASVNRPELTRVSNVVSEKRGAGGGEGGRREDTRVARLPRNCRPVRFKSPLSFFSAADATARGNLASAISDRTLNCRSSRQATLTSSAMMSDGTDGCISRSIQPRGISLGGTHPAHLPHPHPRRGGFPSDLIGNDPAKKRRLSLSLSLRPTVVPGGNESAEAR